MTRTRRGAVARLACSVALLILAGAAAASPADVVLYRIFLRDGSNVVSYGEFARVGGQVVFSIPLGTLDTPAPKLQLVTIAESVVDWPRTDAYAESVRAEQYAATRGETDFAALSTEVARTLNAVALTDDPAKRLALATRAQRTLAEWPSRNYGYRASDVAQLTGLLDEVVSELRVAAGQSRFDLNLVANTAPPVLVPLWAAPTARETVEQALALAHAASEPVQRVSLLRAVGEALAGPAGSESWATALRTRAAADLAVDFKLDTAYAELSSRTLDAAAERVKRGDVKGIEALIKQVLKADDRLGRMRPDGTAALLATLDRRIADARQMRLARDQWTLRLDALRAYNRRTRGMLDQLVRSRGALEQIRQLAGPAPKLLPQLSKRVGAAARELALIKPPPELEAVHGILTSAFQMAVQAADSRARAVGASDMNIAWQASSAAAGALLLLDRARDELQKLASPPGS
jgi:hypothetical protein